MVRGDLFFIKNMETVIFQIWRMLATYCACEKNAFNVFSAVKLFFDSRYC